MNTINTISTDILLHKKAMRRLNQNIRELNKDPDAFYPAPPTVYVWPDIFEEKAQTIYEQELYTTIYITYDAATETFGLIREEQGACSCSDHVEPVYHTYFDHQELSFNEAFNIGCQLYFELEQQVLTKRESH